MMIHMNDLCLFSTGLCGNNNADTTDDFTASSGIVENSAEPFALSWSVGACSPDIPKVCINNDNGTGPLSSRYLKVILRSLID